MYVIDQIFYKTQFLISLNLNSYIYFIAIIMIMNKLFWSMLLKFL